MVRISLTAIGYRRPKTRFHFSYNQWKQTQSSEKYYLFSRIGFINQRMNDKKPESNSSDGFGLEFDLCSGRHLSRSQRCPSKEVLIPRINWCAMFCLMEFNNKQAKLVLQSASMAKIVDLFAWSRIEAWIEASRTLSKELCLLFACPPSGPSGWVGLSWESQVWVRSLVDPTLRAIPHITNPGRRSTETTI